MTTLLRLCLGEADDKPTVRTDNTVIVEDVNVTHRIELPNLLKRSKPDQKQTPAVQIVGKKNGAKTATPPKQTVPPSTTDDKKRWWWPFNTTRNEVTTPSTNTSKKKASVTTGAIS